MQHVIGVDPMAGLDGCTIQVRYGCVVSAEIVRAPDARFEND